MVSPAKMAELNEMTFGVWTLVGPKNNILDGIQVTQVKGQFFMEKGTAHCKV